jgi:polyisoprenoid-binding protein YceI
VLAALAAGRSTSSTASPSASAREPQTWVVDSVHSSVVFRIKHANTAWFYGAFTDVSGEVVYDPEAPEASTVRLRILAESISTRDPKRDAHLKSPDFFDAKQHPAITFTSTKVAAGEDANTFDVTGELELHGVKKSITLQVEKTGEGEFQGPRLGFEATPTVKRSEFGMDYGIAKNVLGDEVTLKISLECKKKG